MLSNYKFGLVRSRTTVPAVPAVPAVPVVSGKTPVVARAHVPVPVPVTKSNRFSVNRIINIKSSGGCRSCG